MTVHRNMVLVQVRTLFFSSWLSASSSYSLCEPNWIDNRGPSYLWWIINRNGDTNYRGNKESSISIVSVIKLYKWIMYLTYVPLFCLSLFNELRMTSLSKFLLATYKLGLWAVIWYRTVTSACSCSPHNPPQLTKTTVMS